MASLTNINEYKKKKQIEQELSRGRIPLFISHKTGKITAGQSEIDYGTRLQNVRNKIDRIEEFLKTIKEYDNDCNFFKR